MKKRWLVVSCLFLALPVGAQTAVEIERLLETPAVHYGEAARFVLEAADVSHFLSPMQAFEYAKQQKWLPHNATASGQAKLSGISLLIMRSFGIKGGLFYSITKSSHHAYRELVYQDVIQGRSDPAMAVSGSELLFMVNRVIPRFDHLQSSAPAEASSLTQEELVRIIEAQIAANGLTDTTVGISEEGVTISLSNIQFMVHSAEIPESEIPKLREIAAILRNIPLRELLVSCHTALAGTEASRLFASLERAEAVKKYLVLEDVRKEHEIAVRGEGSRRPVADNNTPEGMAVNRRVEFTLLEQQ